MKKYLKNEMVEVSGEPNDLERRCHQRGGGAPGVKYAMLAPS